MSLLVVAAIMAVATGLNASPALAQTDLLGGLLGGDLLGDDPLGGDLLGGLTGGLLGGLRYAPPSLTNPTTINVPANEASTTPGNGVTQLDLDNTKDYIVKLPPAKKEGGLLIQGGHNVHVIGGYISANPEKRTTNGDSTTRAIYVKNNAGTVHIEGVLIDGSTGGQSDGIHLNSPGSVVQVENTRVVGLHGGFSTIHPDILTTTEGGGTFKVDKLTGTSNYQGISPFGHGPNEFHRVNVGYESSPYSADDRGGHFVWWTPDATTCATASQTLDEVYVKPRPDRTLGNSVWPTETTPDPCKATISNNAATWPNLPITGSVKLGPPANGDFVPAGVAGIGYISPGYI